MNKIQKMSRFFKVVLLIGMAGVIITPIAIWLTLPEKITPNMINNGITAIGGIFTFKPFPAAIHIQYPFTIGHRLLGLLIKVIPITVSLMVMRYLYLLFANFEKSIIFETQNVRLIRMAAIWLLIGQALSPLYDALMTFAMTIFNQHGYREFSISFGSNNLSIILVALLTLLVSWVMLEAVKLRNENQAFV